jgi:hypothetical protein
VDKQSEGTVVPNLLAATQRPLHETQQRSHLPNLGTAFRTELPSQPSYRRLMSATAAKTLRLGVERRSNRRYPIDLSMQYDLGPQEGPEGARMGSGQVVNISSGGVLVSSDCPITPGVRIRLRLEWPARLNDSVPLALHIEGRTVRSSGPLTAVRILKSEFRTRAVSGVLRQAG